MAAELGVIGLQLRNWLRDEKAKGHPLLAGHEYRGAWRFSPEDASRLMDEFRAVEPRNQPDTETGRGPRNRRLVARDPCPRGEGKPCGQ